MRRFTGTVMEWPPAGSSSTRQQDVHAVNLGATCNVFELENLFISKLWESLKSCASFVLLVERRTGSNLDLQPIYDEIVTCN
jgi:hypothetical protein